MATAQQRAQESGTDENQNEDRDKNYRACQ